jgi:hypothetical protein
VNFGKFLNNSIKLWPEISENLVLRVGFGAANFQLSKARKKKVHALVFVKDAKYKNKVEKVPYLKVNRLLLLLYTLLDYN